MIDELIETGGKLENTVKTGTMGKYLSGIEFETWAAKSVLFLEKLLPNSAVTKRAADLLPSINSAGNYSKYEALLGSLIAAKEIIDSENSNAAKIWDLNK